MAGRPTTQTFISLLKLQSRPDDDTMAVYDEIMQTALDNIESRLNPVLIAAGGYSLADADDNYPQRVRFAVMLEAARLAKRPGSPEGVAGMTDIGAVVRIMGYDPDIERLIRRYRKIEFS
jgi:hypothetical protein